MSIMNYSLIRNPFYDNLLTSTFKNA